MAKISLTDFVDFVLKSGTPKATKLNEIINRPNYHPSMDYYRQAREWIINTHTSGLPKSNIQNLLASLIDGKKSRITQLFVKVIKNGGDQKCLNGTTRQLVFIPLMALRLV